MSEPPVTTLNEQNLQGAVVDANDPARLRRAIELAFDYRGDVTLVRKSDPAPLECFVFDRRDHDGPARAVLRVMPVGSVSKIEVPYADVAELRFTGRDTAAGKSFETWVKKYMQKKLAGEAANIQCESLDGRTRGDTCPDQGAEG